MPVLMRLSKGKGREMDRCFYCDSRYCSAGCNAGKPGYVYTVGHGWLTFPQAAWVENHWATRGLEYGINHGFFRVEWDAAIPDPSMTIDQIRVQALSRDHDLGKIGLHERRFVS